MSDDPETTRRPRRGGGWFAAVAVLLGIAIPYVLAEGIYALARGRKASTSLAYYVYAQWLLPPPPGEADARDPFSMMIRSERELRRFVPLFKASGVGIGNSPFKELKTVEAAINTVVRDGERDCLTQKPNVRKTMAFLRSNLFNPFDQMTYFHDADRVLPSKLQRFLDRYGFRKITLSTNEHGERTTLPRVEAAEKVLVAGDSVADGTMLDDTETIASQLQARDPTRQYVNLGVNGATAADTVCNLERAAARYRGRIARLIYVFCENDFDDDNPYAAPESLIAWLTGFRQRESIPDVDLVYMP